MPKSKHAGHAYCPSCETEVDVAWVDNGIGAYEYWGARGTHHDYVAECSVCGEAIPDFEEVTPDDYDYERDDFEYDSYRERRR